MERFLQYLDDLDDLMFAFALVWERIRGKLRFAIFVGAALTLQLAGVFLALVNPPMAVAAASVLLVVLMLRGVTSITPGTAVEA